MINDPGRDYDDTVDNCNDDNDNNDNENYDNDNEDNDNDDDDDQCRWWQHTARLPAPISTPSAGWAESQKGLGSLHQGCQGHQALPSRPLPMHC